MHAPLRADSRRQIVQALARQVRHLEDGRRGSREESVSTGCEALDRLLPDGGFRRGTLVEWFSDSEGSGAATLSLHSAREACREGHALVMIDGRGEFYPPAAAGLGIDLTRTILVRPVRADDEFWALDQALRCRGVGAVWSWQQTLADRAFRRLQLAAEAGGVLGLFLRPMDARSAPSWAEVRLSVEPLPSPLGRRWRVQLLRCRAAARSSSIEIEWNDETGVVRLASKLGDTAPQRRSAGA